MAGHADRKLGPVHGAWRRLRFERPHVEPRGAAGKGQDLRKSHKTITVFNYPANPLMTFSGGRGNPLNTFSAGRGNPLNTFSENIGHNLRSGSKSLETQ